MKIRDPWLVVGFIAGGLIGLAISWLFAPSSGRTTISKISEDMARARAEARTAGKRAEADIDGRYDEMRRLTAALDERPASSPIAMPMSVGNGNVRGRQVPR